MTTILMILLACTAEEYEGDSPGECDDGADNDQDGYFDCEDNGCWGSSSCDEADTDTDSDADTDTDTDADADSDADSDTDADSDADTDTDTDTGSPTETDHLKAVTIDYSLDWDFAIPPFGLDDCVQTFTGSGNQVAASGTELTLEGTWVLASSTCAESLDTAIWVPDNGVAWHTFRFETGMASLNDWLAHSEAGNAADAEWYITDMAASFSGNSATHTEDEYISDSQLTLTHDVTVTFTE